jgi:hypothetical protein
MSCLPCLIAEQNFFLLSTFCTGTMLADGEMLTVLAAYNTIEWPTSIFDEHAMEL